MRIKKLLSFTVNTLLLVLCVVAILTVLAKFSLAGVSLYVVQSGSMEPAIKTGSAIFVIESNTYRIGEVVTRKTENPEVTVTHRIVGERNENGLEYQTKGDANAVADAEWFRSDTIIGKELISIPFFGYVISFAQTSLGFILLVIIPAVLIIYEELRNIKKQLVSFWQSRKNAKETVEKPAS